jgi:biotin carboxylase
MARLLLLLPATTYRAGGFLDAAQRLKLEVTIGAEVESGLPHSNTPEHLKLNFRDSAESARLVVAYAKNQPIHAVVGVDDHTTVLAAVMSAALGLPHNSLESVSATRNKHLLREVLRQHGVPAPQFTLFSTHDDPQALAGEVIFPCVLKPLSLSASCGVIRANSSKEFVAAFHRIAALLEKLGVAESTDGSGRRLLVEDFIPGREVALEGLLTQGMLTVLALFDKPDPLEGPFFEETIYVTPSRLPKETQNEIAVYASRAAEAIGLREGPVHCELRVNQEGVWVIEVAARSIGGRCSRSLRFAAGMSLEELILQHALRMELPPLAREQQAAGVMMLPIPAAGVLHEVCGQAEALAVPGIEELEIVAQPGEELLPLPEGTRYLGFLIARGDSPDAVEASLRDAHKRLSVIIGPGAAQAGKVLSF